MTERTINTEERNGPVRGHWTSQDYLLLEMEEELLDLEDAYIQGRMEEYVKSFRKATVTKKDGKVICVTLRRMRGNHIISICTQIRRIIGSGALFTNEEADEAYGIIKGDMCRAIEEIYR